MIVVRRFVFLVVLMTATHPPPLGAALILIAEDAPLTDLYNVYAPHILGDRMWMGGWLIPEHAPDDRIYLSERIGDAWSTPVTALAEVGAAVNDPSVIAVGGETLMYFTRLAKDCTPVPDCWFVGNLTGLAVSSDNGDTWENVGVAIDLDNGLSQCGAWAPSAITVGNEIWVYYHGGLPSYGACEYPLGTVFRSRFDAMQLQRIDTVRVDLPKPLYNVDVSQRPDGDYVLVANSLDLTRMHLFTSQDGLAWSDAGTFPIPEDLIWKPAPHLTWSDATTSELWAGHAENAQDVSSREIHRWRWQDDQSN